MPSRTFPEFAINAVQQQALSGELNRHPPCLLRNGLTKALPPVYIMYNRISGVSQSTLSMSTIGNCERKFLFFGPSSMQPPKLVLQDAARQFDPSLVSPVGSKIVDRNQFDRYSFEDSLPRFSCNDGGLCGWNKHEQSVGPCRCSQDSSHQKRTPAIRCMSISVSCGSLPAHHVPESPIKK